LTTLAHPPEVDTRTARAPVPDASATSDAAATLYSLHRQRIHAYCLGQLRDRQEADDAVQSTFLYALALLKRGETPRAELPWLYTIAHNVCRTRRRALKRRSRLESGVDLETLHDSVGRNDPSREELAGLGSSLASLPPAQRSALLLREWQGLSYAEIALRLGLTESAVEAVLFRARRNLAQTLRRTGDRAASLASIVMLMRGLRRLAPFTTVGKTAVAAVAVGAAVATAVHPLVTSPSGVDHKPAPAATATADALQQARHKSTPIHARVRVQTRARATDEHTILTSPSIPTTQTEPATNSSATAVVSSIAADDARAPATQTPEPSSKATHSGAPGAEPSPPTPAQAVLTDVENALPSPPDIVSSLPPAVQPAVATVTTPVQQVVESVVSSPPVQAVVTTVTSPPPLPQVQLAPPPGGTLLPGQP
jgi:RNA polymerase sigma factor (sigma-70 family)